jgi:4-hydroxy-2-oxoheptanedioate aldolase
MIEGIKMRPSRVLGKLRSGGVVSCVKLNLSDSRAFEIAAMAGFDCLWTDMEHVGNDWSAIEKQVLAAKAYNTDIMVRISRGGYSDYIRPLELDATGIMVPHIMSFEDAKKVVNITRFQPVGRRPIDGGNADGAYCNINPLDYIKDANKERFVVVQIEDPEAVNDIERIASLEGIDMLFFGPGDFSHAIGALGQSGNSTISEVRKRIAEACRKSGKYAGTVGGLENLNELIRMGYRFISVGADVICLSQYFANMAKSFNDIVDNTVNNNIP